MAQPLPKTGRPVAVQSIIASIAAQASDRAASQKVNFASGSGA